MKAVFALILLLVIGSTVANAGIINWTNTAGGNWSVAANWNPNQVLGSSDDVVITANGPISVLLNTSFAFHSRMFGGSSGLQTLTWTYDSIGAVSTLTVGTNGLLVLAGINANVYSLFGALTNAGIVRLSSGDLQINSYYASRRLDCARQCHRSFARPVSVHG